MSSAILYLAIVAIWACVLVPRWLRRPHEQPSDQEAVFESYDSGEVEAADTGEPAEGDPYAEAPDFTTLREQGAVAHGDPVAWEDPPVPDWADGPAEATYSVTATYSAEVTYSAETAAGEADQDAYYDYETPPHGGHAPPYSGDAPPYSGDVPRYNGDVPRYNGDVPRYSGDVPHPGHVTHGPPADSWQQPHLPDLPVTSPGPSSHIVQARRRTLTMVLLIAVAVIGSAFIGLTPWWTAVPPFLMLGAYLALLHEAARADAEHAHRWAEAQAFHAARRAELAREHARQAQAVAPPEPTAQIITLATSASRADDQLYDQYADAEIRAVGD